MNDDARQVEPVAVAVDPRLTNPECRCESGVANAQPRSIINLAIGISEKTRPRQAEGFDVVPRAHNFVVPLLLTESDEASMRPRVRPDFNTEAREFLELFGLEQAARRPTAWPVPFVRS